MERLGCANRMVPLAVSALLLALLLPATVGAKVPPESASEAPPGITVRGIGFAKRDAGAAQRAVRDARVRAGLIAKALGLQVGEVESVELPELSQFGGETRRCGSREDRADGCGPAVAAASVTFAIVGGALGEGSGRTVRASGTASAPVHPRNRDLSRSIKRAIFGARRLATPEAAAIALRNARTAAGAAGLELGPIVSVAETSPAYFYGPYFYDFGLGSFGPGRFCGIVRRPVVRRDPDTGEARVVRRVPHRRCFLPARYDVHLEVRYEAS